MAIELEPEGIKVNAVSPGFTKTNLNGYAGTETVEEGAREAVRVALLGPDGPTGTFTRWENETDPVVTRYSDRPTEFWNERRTESAITSSTRVFGNPRRAIAVIPSQRVERHPILRPIPWDCGRFNSLSAPNSIPVWPI